MRRATPEWSKCILIGGEAVRILAGRSGVDLRASLPEIVVCLQFVAFLVIRLAPRYDQSYRLDRSLFAAGACVLSCLQWAASIPWIAR